MLIFYQGEELIKTKPKRAGKNSSEYDGFYQNVSGKEFFIKQPVDAKELFTELFAGLLIKEFKQRGLIPPRYHNSLICADFIQFEDKSYGLIQPRIYFTELYKVIKTGYRDNSDRNPFLEMFLGPRYYPSLLGLERYFGLSMALMFSLLVGDNSVHSGNVVCLDTGSEIEKIIQFARIDFGAAFRHFGYKDNNSNILYPFEYQGWLNLKGYTKGYFYNYKNIPGLFPVIAKKAKAILPRLHESLLIDMVASALKKIPVDLVNEKTKFELAKHLGLESFAKVCWDSDDKSQLFVVEFAHLLNERLKKISELEDSSFQQDKSKLYESVIEENTVSVNSAILIKSFPQQIAIFCHLFSTLDEKTSFDFTQVQLPQLVEQFNSFLNALLEVGGAESSEISDIPEVDILRQLYFLKSDATPCFSSSKHEYSEESAGRENKSLEEIKILLTLSFDIVVTFRVALQTIQDLNEHEISRQSVLDNLCEALKERLFSFKNVYQQVAEVILDHMKLSAELTEISCKGKPSFFGSNSAPTTRKEVKTVLEKIDSNYCVKQQSL